jgi:DNA-binding beta-propeller fold protein YncE
MSEIDDGPLLDYTFLTDPDPLQASTPARLTLVISDGTNTAIDCTYVAVTFPTGVNAKDLTADPNGIATVAPSGWTIEQNGGTFTLTPVTPDRGRIGRDAVAFVFSGVAVNDEPGECGVQIDENAQTSSEPAGDRYGVLRLSKFPAQFSVSDMTATPTEVPSGGSTTLMWSGSPANYTLYYDPDGLGQQHYGVGQFGPYPVSNLTNGAGVSFTLVVQYTLPGSAQILTLQRQCQVAVAVPLPSITEFTGTVGNLFTSGETVALTWAAAGRDVTCSIGGFPQQFSTSGSVTAVRPGAAAHSSYTLTAQNFIGATTSTLDVHWTAAVTSIALADTPRNVAIAPDGSRAYVCCTNSLVAFDMATKQIAGSPAAFPQGLTLVNVSPDGARLYLTSMSQQTVTIVNAGTLTAEGAPIGLSFDFVDPSGAMVVQAAVSPDDGRLFVPPGFVGPPNAVVVDLIVGRQTGSIGVGPTPGAVAVSPDGSTLLVGTRTAGTVTFVSAATLQSIGEPIAMQSAEESYLGGNLAFSADGTRAYAVFPAESGLDAAIVALDVSAKTQVGSPVTIGDQSGESGGLAVSPDGSLLFCGAVGKLYVLQASPLQVLTTIDIGTLTAHDVQISPDGSWVLVAASGAQALGLVRLPWSDGGVS